MIVEIFLLIFTSIVTQYLFSHLLSVYSTYRSLSKIPSIDTLPIVGNTLQFIKGNETSTRTLYRVLMDLGSKAKDKGIFRLQLFHFPIVVIFNPSYVQTILSGGPSTSVMGSVYVNKLSKWLKTGLGTSEGEKWKGRRRLLTPIFHSQNLMSDSLFSVNQHSIQLCKTIAREREQADLNETMASYTLSVILDFAMGVTASSNMEQFFGYKKAIREFGKFVINSSLNPIYWYDFTLNFTSLGTSLQTTLQTLHSFSDKIINLRSVEWRRCHDSAVGNIDESSAGKKSSAFLDYLFDQHFNMGAIDLPGIKEEVDAFTFAGHDTTSCAISFCLYNIARHEHVSSKLKEEIRKVFGNKVSDIDDRLVTEEDLCKLSYLDTVIKESLRLYPPTPIMIRKLLKEMSFDDRLKLPVGTEVMIHIPLLHRDELQFPDPEIFDPERFLLNNSLERHPYAYIPFSAGNRNCIAQRFAMIELKVTIANILRKFNLSLPSGKETVNLATDLTLVTVDPISVTFTLIQEFENTE